MASMYENNFQIEGLKETLDAFKEIADEIGDKKATSKFLIPSMKQAMVPVLNAARALVPRETQALAKSLEIQAKRPTARDRRSKYVSQTDTVIVKVQTKPIAAKHKKEAKELGKTLAQKNIKLDKKKFYEARGYYWDARAVANEFGTKNRAAKPYLRPALESQSTRVVEILASIINNKIQQYRSKKK